MATYILLTLLLISVAIHIVALWKHSRKEKPRHAIKNHDALFTEIINKTEILDSMCNLLLRTCKDPEKIKRLRSIKTNIHQIVCCSNACKNDLRQI